MKFQGLWKLNLVIILLSGYKGIAMRRLFEAHINVVGFLYSVVDTYSFAVDSINHASMNSILVGTSVSMNFRAGYFKSLRDLFKWLFF